ncbi:aminotransferase class I/II-fold pyridoxal phosphate-dependent enzyme [Amnibacterium sp. CER49]|uniref:MalY/PatB family protein n=1 Tax=Amnibacterium sp. CER49 TaxID=3039161 RepID=UPI0024485564|nr:aminotransferase class I/II-fold pyridoxal phosphate-dependent enzyme [Amnibacterium sp. CER49]MDH2445521.1 aminotransferase class I/II-fold pyridoxal phosphate-dependent enzyme [Amnibacterium sp. CER49]
MSAHPFDSIRPDDLRAGGSVKWTAFPEAMGAFVAEMDFGLAPAITAALHEAVEVARTGYVPSALTDGLRAATAAWCADRFGWSVPAERVQPLGDVLAGLELVLRHYSDPSAAVIVPTPAYMPFLTLPTLLGRRIIQVPSPEVDGRYELDLVGIARAFEQGADVLVLCNPWNPVGRVLDRDELLAVAEVVDRYGGRVFADEIHAPLVFAPHRHVPYASVSDAAAAHALTAISASKAFDLPGLKCAQLVLSNDADAERFVDVGAFAAHGASGFGVIANTAAYRGGGAWLDDVLGYLDGNRRRFGELLAERLPQVGYRRPEGTYIAWLDIRRLDLGDAPADALLERAGVALTDGAACGTPGFLRCVLATPRPVLEELVDRIAEAVG